MAALVLLFALARGGTAATPLPCPDLSAAVQVGTCPTEEELKYTFTGYCSDNARMYDKDQDNECSNYQRYRRLKNVVLWESADGSFHGYLSCDLPASAIKGAKPGRIAVSRQGRLTRLVCSYPDGILFVHRTKGECQVEGSGDCAADPAACRASCN
jgi:hypothetical protein